MWKTLIGTLQDIYELNRRVKGHDKHFEELFELVRGLSLNQAQLSDRVLRLELQLQHQKEQQSAERENFRLQLENLMLRQQRGLLPGEPNE